MSPPAGAEPAPGSGPRAGSGLPVWDRAALLAANLEAVGARFPGLARILEASPAEGLEADLTPSGDPTARLAGGPWLHSTRSPRAEARRLASACLSRGEDCAVLLGFGLGYQAEACLEAGAERILVVEAEAGMLKAALGLRDLSALLGDERLGFMVGGEPEALIGALELSGAAKAGILALRAAEQYREDWYGRAAAAARRWLAKTSINENTLRRFGRLWVRNLARSIGHIAEARGVSELEGAFAGIPALVLAAGPSLDLVLPHVREISRRALIVCVDTALRSILRVGIEPDFLVVVDPQYWNWRHVADLESPGSFLVSESAAWPAVFRRRSRSLFLGGSLFPLGRAIESLSGIRGSLGAGGSVATSAWDLARLMGCPEIWMAGLDLGFPGGSTHAGASLFEQRSLATGRRLRPGSTSLAAALLDSRCFKAASNEGGEVLTDERMSLYAWWFESRLARSDSPTTFSLCPGGLAIPGMICGPVEELLARPVLRPRIDQSLDCLALWQAPASAEGKGEEGLVSLLAALEAIARAAETAHAAAREAAARNAAGLGDLGDLLELLDRSDALILASAAKDVAGFLMPPMSRLLARRARDLKESLEQSAAVYASVAESARYHLEVLGEGRPA